MFKELSLSTILLIFGSSTFLSANQDNSYSDKTSKQNDHHMQASQPPMREITPPAGPMVADGIDFFISADYILWKTSTGTSVLIQSQGQTVATTAAGTISIGSKTLPQTTYGWDSGFKVGMGADLGMDGWSLFAEYTWLRPSASQTVGGAPSNPLVINAFGPAAISNLASGKTTFKEDLAFNNIDLMLNRSFYVSPCLTLMPSIGLKGTWQSFDKTITAKNVELEYLITDFDADSSKTKEDNSIWGIAIAAALDFDFYIVNCFSIYGSLSVAQFFQSYQFDTSTKLSGITNPPAVETFENKASLTSYAFIPWCFAELGMKYDVYFDDNNYHMSLQAGWEAQWFGSWLQRANQGNFGSSDLTLGGLNVKARFDF